MLAFLVATLFVRQGSPVQVLQHDVPANRFFALRLSSTEKDQSAGDVAAAMKACSLIDKYDTGRLAGYVWDASGLLPTFMPSGRDREVLAASKSFGDLISLSGVDGKQFLRPIHEQVFDETKGASLAQLPSEAAKLVSNGVPEAVPLVRNQDTRITICFNTYVGFQASDGRYKSFILKPSREGGQLSVPPTAFRRATHDRLPKELRTLLNHRLHPTAPTETKTLSEFASVLSEQAGLTLLVDYRVENDKLYLRYPSTSDATFADEAESLAYAMDLYWRKVGSSYFLAVSPEDPRAWCEAKFTEQVCRAAKPLFDLASKSGLLPGGLDASDFLRSAEPLSNLDPASLSALADIIDYKAGRTTRNEFLAVVNDSAFLMGTLHFSAIGFSTVASYSAHLAVSSAAVHFEVP